jgi:hypothetical protein
MHYSTDVTMFKYCIDIPLSLDKDNFAMITLPDLSQLHKICSSADGGYYGFDGTVFPWLISDPHGRVITFAQA